MAFLVRVGKTLEKNLKRNGIETCEALIFYFPRRYDDFSLVVPIAELRPDMCATIHGRIDMLANRRSKKSRMIVTEALVSDDTGSVHVAWFNQPFLTKNLSTGDIVSLSGKTNSHYYDLQLVSPAYEKIPTSSRAESRRSCVKADRSEGSWKYEQNRRGSSVSDIGMTSLLNTGRLVPVYSLPQTITQKQFRALARACLEKCRDNVHEWLPKDILSREKFPSLRDALFSVHFPETKEEAEKAQKRFKFEELFLLQLSNARARSAHASLHARSIPFNKRVTQRFIAGLPFTLTQEQKKAAWEILRAMERSAPMNCLLQGDVGAGKTIVACIAILNAVSDGCQCAIMAPTEVLAQQHFKTLCRLFYGFDISIALVTSHGIFCHPEANAEGHIGAGKRRCSSDMSTFTQLRRDFARNDIVIGTHALIQEKIQFKNLALAVIDEQHRFGVKQRKTLREKNTGNTMPHLLSMTATPIPRSLALTVYGDLDIFTIRTLPKGRKKIITKIVPQNYREWTYEFIRKQIAAGYQAYVLCAIINPSDVLGARSVTDEYKRLTAGSFSRLRVGMLHGRMKAEEKEKVMSALHAHELDILVTTSVIEVGIDVPRANVMFIEGAERFGLAQLHQLRGRVGRAECQSYCFLAPSDETKEEIERLKAVVASNDGFALAEQDLRLRGEGDVFGTRQSGVPRLKIATLFDVELIQKAREYAEKYSVAIDAWPELKARIEAFQNTAHLE